jgi:hypothetical protein
LKKKILCIFGGISPGVETKEKITLRMDGMKELTAVENFVPVFGDDFIFVVRFDDILKFWVFNFGQKNKYHTLDYV